MPRKKKSELILVDQIEPLIHEIRGERVILDQDLAKLYGIETKTLNRAVGATWIGSQTTFSYPLRRKRLQT